MHFFDLPLELRLQIYSELLVFPEPIVFELDYDPGLLPLVRCKRGGLCPALLRVNKKVYSEANMVFYSDNHFRFPEMFVDIPSITESIYFALFFCQVGSQASHIRHIRHISIPFPTFDDFQHDRAELQESALLEGQFKGLELVRDNCTNIKAIELCVGLGYANYILTQSPIAAEALDLLDTHFKSIPSLQEVIINFEVPFDEDPSDLLTKKIQDHGWKVKVTRLPKQTWISEDERVAFDNEEDCRAYDWEQLFLDQQREERKEREEWVEEYYRRKRDPYWKNDSDYD